MIFINLPAKDLEASKRFYAALGFKLDAELSDDTSACVAIEDGATIVMLLTEAIAAGGKPWKPATDEGPYYGRSVQDLDGHVWEFVHYGRT